MTAAPIAPRSAHFRRPFALLPGSFMAPAPASQTIASLAVEPPRRRRSAAARSSKSPTAVGPEPVSIACRGARAAQGVERVADLGTQRARRRLEVVDEQLRVGERRGAGAGRRAQPRRRAPRAPPASRPRPRRSASAKTSAVLSPPPPGSRTTACGTGSGSRSTRSPAPRTSASAGPAARARRRRARPRSPRGPPTSPAASRRTAAASALPPPRPAATGIRFSISIRSGGALPAALAQRGQRPRGEVLALRRLADDLVALGLLDRDPVGQRQRLEQGAELVQAVGAGAARGRGRG